MKLKYIRMINCQSFIDVTFELTSGLNVLFAENETGKSIYQKMLDCFCWGGNFSRPVRETVIRDFTARAELHLMTEDDTLIKFNMYPTYSEYYMGDTYYRENYIPEDIKNKLGWIVDTNEEILLNQMDVAKASPLIGTSSTYNAKLLGPHLNPVILNTTIDNLEGKVLHLKPIRNRLTRRANVLAASLGKRKNLSYIESQINLAQEYDILLEKLKEFKLCKKEPEVVTVPEYSSDLINLFNISEPVEVDIPEYRAEELIKLCNLGEPVDIKIPEYIVNRSLMNLVELDAPRKPKLVDYVVELFNLFTTREPEVSAIPEYDLHELINLVNLVEPVQSPEIKRIEMEIKICPTCNQNLEW